MDKFKGLAKGGWHPAGDRGISRDSWRSDLKGIATGKKEDPHSLQARRDHQSAPLSSLRDPSSFGAPPKQTGAYGSGGGGATGFSSPGRPGGGGGGGGGAGALPPSSGGLGGPVPTPSRRQQQPMEEEPPKPPEPYRMDTSGLKTDHLPKPPVRRGDGAGSPAGSAPGPGAGRTASPSLPARTASPKVPPRQTPPLPSRAPVAAAKPPPALPPRMTENPNEYTPPPPPTYGEAMKPGTDAGQIDEGAASRLGQAGVSVPGFGIGGQLNQQQQQPAQPQGHSSQLGELQQRFSRMNTGSQPSATSNSSPAAAAAAKKSAPPPPKKKSTLTAGAGQAPQQQQQQQQQQYGNAEPSPPPLPLSSKPKPGS
ncbi:hypothetical protein KC343_g2141 [Hortaea werneckii]|uniref:Uncharacterized protein n=1 Tax=Hortaea werneckii TaxID=91943 RepID=A0A3M7GHT0_HORWE|nr:hypothetical protein KC338_g6746 [Hortaea werneckii]KAI6864547.1 hypothetical protein KC323_g4715 [Hortaea werneckii]KAI7348380.1 hypothetical protein KC320_g6662 [Hortaea werneckii]KAI7569762.1 hypothetical protein KC317_g3039 [Hortaea werneckii]KAI7616895.1 hypothetical protein KC346_g5762 [Hortaea werneckii]